MWSKFDTTSALAAAGASMAAAEALQPVWSKFDTTSALAAAGAVAATKHAVASVGGSIPGFDDVAHSLLEELQLVTDEGEEAVAFAPSDDDRAYAVLKEAAPEVAEAVDVASSKVKTPFWSRRAVRNSLAWTLLTIALALHALGAVLPEPWKSILGALLGAGDISAFSAYKLAAPPSKSEPAEQAGDTGDH
ncbi:MAG: hypothetical protein CVT65_16990 [Actinobacteria bacterium HGW-Actinobacteria-5]|nr:MAG: hypothetical protein CVT65_16990 [Actinobacteria bacterium HGW-Actinobacteria-5]